MPFKITIIEFLIPRCSFFKIYWLIVQSFVCSPIQIDIPDWYDETIAYGIDSTYDGSDEFSEDDYEGNYKEDDEFMYFEESVQMDGNEESYMLTSPNATDTEAEEYQEYLKHIGFHLM